MKKILVGGHIQLSVGFLKVQKADTGDIALVRQRLKHGNGRRACGRIAFQPLDQPFHLILLSHIGVQTGSVGVLMMQLRHFLLHGEIADHPIIFHLHLMLFDDCVGQRGILHLCGQIQQLLDLCAFTCIVGINSFRPPWFPARSAP